MQRHHHDAAWCQCVDQLGCRHVLRRLGDRVAGRAEPRDAADRSELRGQVRHPGAVGQQRRERLHQQERADRVDAQAVLEGGLGHGAEALTGMQHAGVVDQQVDPGRAIALRDQRQFAHQRVARARVSDVERQDVQAARVLPRQRVQVGRAARLARGGDHPPAGGQQLADEFQAEAAVGAGDQRERVVMHAASLRARRAGGLVAYALARPAV